MGIPLEPLKHQPPPAENPNFVIQDVNKPADSRMTIIFGLVFALGLIGTGIFLWMHRPPPPELATQTKQNSNTQSNQSGNEEIVPSLTTFTHTPVNPKALPLGDQLYTSTPKKGYIYLCRTQTEDKAGAGVDGPWINTSAKTWDSTAKVAVSGSVTWPNPKWSISSSGSTRTLTTNGYPSHTTGIYPIQSTDAAYAYDRNPNSIKAQSLTVSLPATPTLLSTPECMGGESGVMLSGIPLFNGFDAGSRDAAAHELQDSCSGHPQVSGMYHYHSYSKCLTDKTAANEHSALVGYALDGFGIYGLKSEGGQEVSTADLDECHGHSHEIVWDGKTVTMYHYHMTQDFPYSVSCFRGKKAVNGPLSTGGGSGQGGMQAGPQPSGGPPGDGRIPPPRFNQ